MIKKSLVAKAISLDLPSDKNEAIKVAIKALTKNLSLEEDEVFEAVMAREKALSTAIGLGVAIPHAKIKSIKKFAYSIFCSEDPINFQAPDKTPVRIIVLLLSPENKMKEHVTLLAEISRRLKFSHVRQAILEAKTPKKVAEAFLQAK
ncbi:MAG: hypothetical protein AUJ18_04070 [Candidatus Hydrogenedentes bacterium CG1_02_42_14]|nr:MAG: hypothetical protein AUJ18_04070 [Candidatus Hydrogenedentes bacterium CG1_02_42_14]